MKRHLFPLLLASFACLVAPAVLSAATPAEAKAHMRERVPAIDKLKLSESVGENNRGFLEARKPDAEAVVAAENADRAVVFADAASRAGSSADAVGRAFARQVAAASAPGVWLQSEDGKWYRK